MKPVWKWIIGIVVGLIVLALLVGAAFLVHGRLISGRIFAANPIPAPNSGRILPGKPTLPGPGTGQVLPGNRMRRFGVPGNGTPYHGMPGYGMPYSGMRGYGWHSHGMMGFGPMMFFIPFAGLLFGLGWLGWLVLLVVGIVWLVRRPGGRQPAAAPVLSACPRCANPVQAGWNNCPNCGKKL